MRNILIAVCLFFATLPAHAQSFGIQFGNRHGSFSYYQQDRGYYAPQRPYVEYRYVEPPRVEYRYVEPPVRRQVYEYRYPSTAAICVGRASDGRLYEYYC